MDWTSLFASLDLNNLIPDCYEKWKPFVKGGLAWFLGRLSEDRQKEILADQLGLGLFASAADRLENRACGAALPCTSLARFWRATNVCRQNCAKVCSALKLCHRA